MYTYNAKQHSAPKTEGIPYMAFLYIRCTLIQWCVRNTRFNYKISHKGCITIFFSASMLLASSSNIYCFYSRMYMYRDRLQVVHKTDTSTGVVWPHLQYWGVRWINVQCYGFAKYWQYLSTLHVSGIKIQMGMYWWEGPEAGTTEILMWTFGMLQWKVLQTVEHFLPQSRGPKLQNKRTGFPLRFQDF